MPCSMCGDSGWIITERGGVSGADRCPCSPPKPRPADRRPTEDECLQAVCAIASMVPFFADSDLAKTLVRDQLLRWVGTKSQLDWLTEKAMTTLTQKHNTLADLKGLFCSEYWPADGHPVLSEIPGFSPAQLTEAKEAAAARIRMEEDTRRLEGYREQANLLPAAERAPFLLPAALPAVKTMPPTHAQIRKLEEDLKTVARRPARSEEENRLLEESLARELEHRRSSNA